MRKKLTLKEVQQCEVGMLQSFVEFCELHDIRYYLAGGTLLGAIRHKGFIPWDDDIDVLVPREDYVTFLNLAPEFEAFSSGRYQVTSNYLHNLNHVFCKIFDKHTYVDTEFIDEENEHHLWIDILPLDGLPDDTRKVSSIYRNLDVGRKALSILRARSGAGKTSFKKLVKPVIKGMLSLIGKQRIIRWIDSYSQRYSLDESQYVGAVAMGLYGPGERMPKEQYLTSVKVEFEGLQLNAPSCWDYYLRSLYGDYMQLPPEEQRSGHYIQAWMKD